MLVELVGEAIGTFAFFAGIFFLTSKSQTNVHFALTAFAIGLCLTVGILISSLSGSKSFLNPAVALSMLMSNKISLGEFGGYTLAEIVGAILAVLYVKGVNPTA